MRPTQAVKEKIQGEFAKSVVDRILKREPVLYYEAERSQWVIKTDSGGKFRCDSFGESLQELANCGVRRVEIEFDGFELGAAAVTLTKSEATAIHSFLLEHWGTFTARLEAESLFSADDIEALGNKLGAATVSSQCNP